MSNIVVSGYYGSKNAGDEAMLAAMIEVLSDVDPQVNITVISTSPKDTERRHGVAAIGWLDVAAVCRALKGADLLISGGGSLLQNVTSGRSLYYYLGIIAIANFVGTPVMLYAQGIGPVCGAFARSMMRRFVDKADFITVRDKGSLEELHALDVKRPPIEVTADPVLAIHPVNLSIGQKIYREYQITDAKPLIGISVREWRNLAEYKTVVANVADEIANKYGAQIIFLPMQVPEDVVASKAIALQMKEDAVVLTEEYTTEELLSLVGSLDVLISVRLHALIFAAVMGVPAIGLSYDPKIERFLSSLGEKPAGDLTSITLEKLRDCFENVWKNRDKIKRKNKKAVAPLRHLAMKNAEEAIKLIEKTKRKNI